MQQAIANGATAIAKVLLKQPGLDIHASDQKGRSPLHNAARLGAAGILLELLVQPGINILQKGPDGKAFLHDAAMRKHPLHFLTTIRDQLTPDQFRALTEARDDFQCLPVSRAAEHGASDAVLALLKPSIAVAPLANVATSFQRGWILRGFDTLDFASLAQLGREGGIEMHEASDGDNGEALIYQKLRRLHIQRGDLVLVTGHCSWNADSKRVDMWLNKHTSVPLVEVALLLYEMGVKKAVFIGCEVNMAVTGLRNRFARDPMIWRPQKGSTTLESMDYTFIGRKGETAFDLNVTAAEFWIDDCVDQRPHTQTNDGALFKFSVQPLRTLGWDAATATWTLSRRSALNADRLSHLDASQASELKADLLLMHAHAGKTQECINLITRHGVHPDVRSITGYTPLMLACSTNRTPTVELLLKHNASVDLVDNYGVSALGLACSEGCVESAKVLLAVGADPHLKGPRGSAWDIAQSNGHTAILKLLPPPPAQPPTV